MQIVDKGGPVSFRAGSFDSDELQVRLEAAMLLEGEAQRARAVGYAVARAYRGVPTNAITLGGEVLTLGGAPVAFGAWL